MGVVIGDVGEGVGDGEGDCGFRGQKPAQRQVNSRPTR